MTLVLGMSLGTFAGTKAGSERSILVSTEIQEALWLGMDYMVRSASNPENFTEYASDYLFFFADVYQIDDPWIQHQAKTHGLRLGDVYLKTMFPPKSADDLIDCASALYALEILGMDIEAPLAILQMQTHRYSQKNFLGFDPIRGEAPDLDLLIDLLIGFHFTERVAIELPDRASFYDSLLYVASVEYDSDQPLGSDRYIDQNNLITHLVYTLSGYASWSVPLQFLPREYEYIRSIMPETLMWADPETLSEFVDSLKLLGFNHSDEHIAHGINLLLSLQKPDGRWEPEEVEDEYDRYHATWCAMDALRDYDLVVLNQFSQSWLVKKLLENWSYQYTKKKPWVITSDKRTRHPMLMIGSDLPQEE